MKPNKFLAALTAAALAAANSALFTPTFFATAEGGFTPPGKVDGNCTANISIVDITTGESLDGFEIMLEQNPTGTGTILDRWLTTDEPVKTFTDLAAGVYYGLLISDTLKDEGIDTLQNYSLASQIFFSFDEDGETQDITLRAVPYDAEKKVRFYAYDWTDAVSVNDSFFDGVKEYPDFFKVSVYDKDGKFFTSEVMGGRDAMYLPDGKYTVKFYPYNEDYDLITADDDIAKKAMEMFDDVEFPDKDKGLDIEVRDGMLTKETELFFKLKPEVVDYNENGCKVNISVVDMYTNEPVKGVKARLVYVSENKVMAEWDTTEEPVKSVNGLYTYTSYDVQILDVPEGYHIDKNFWLNFYKKGVTKDLVIKAVPIDGEPNIDVAVYDWTDLVVDPEKDIYEGYKAMDPDDYILQVISEEYGSFDASARDLHMPDGKYHIQVIDKTGEYRHVDNEGGKARAIHRMFGQDFVIPDGVSLDMEIKDGKTVGQPCLFFEKDRPEDYCTLNIKVLDGETGKPADAAECEIIRIAEALEDKAEILSYDELIMNSLTYYPMENEEGFKETLLEPGVKYAVVARSGNKKYGSGKPVFVSFDEKGQTKDVTVKLYPYYYTEGCSMTISIPDAETGKTADGAEYKVVYLQSVPKDMPETVTAKDILEKGTVIEEGKMPKDADSVTVSGLKSNSWYAVIAESGSNRYGMPRAVLVVFGDNGDTENVVLKLYPYTSYNPCSLNVQIMDAVTEKPAFAEFKVIRIPDELADKAEELDITTLYAMGVTCGLGGISEENSSVEIKNLEPDTKYAVLLTDFSRMYSGVKPVIVSFDKAGQTKDVTIKLYPYNYNDCSASIDAVDVFKKERITGLEIRLYEIPEELGASPDRAAIFESGKLIDSFRPSDDTVGVFLNLKSDVLYAAVVDGYSIAYACPDPVFFSFSGSEKTKNISIDMQPSDYTPYYGDVNCDNRRDLSDAILIMQALANPNKYGINGTDQGHLTTVGKKNADVVGKDGMTPDDALAIQQYLLGILKTLG